MRALLITAAMLFLAAPAKAGDKPSGWIYERPPPKQGYSYPDCYCTDSTGERVEVGQTACLTINRQQVTARCEQANNLTIWRQKGQGCATSPSS